MLLYFRGWYHSPQQHIQMRRTPERNIMSFCPVDGGTRLLVYMIFGGNEVNSTHGIIGSIHTVAYLEPLIFIKPTPQQLC